MCVKFLKPIYIFLNLWYYNRTKRGCMQLFFDIIKYRGNIPINNGLYGFIYFFTQIIGILFILLYFHQFVFVILSSLKAAKIPQKVFKLHKIGFVISARNESNVIANLINSIRNNDYPQAMVNIFVVADNCTDNTAQICRDLGCIVVERFDQTKIGKGYALNYLFTKLHTEPEYADVIPDAYIIADADNVMTSNYITEMNKVYDSGYDVVASYRNTKNFGTNWISAGYGYWFLHESKHLNNARMIFNSSCFVMGTGFLISVDTIKEFNNWDFYTLTEDVQFSTEYALRGKKVGYCGNAEFFDEQPEKFKQSWNQRVRWARGYYQVYGLKGKELIKNMFKNFSCWDTLTSIFPAMILSLLTVVVLPICSIIALCVGDYVSALLAFTSLLANLAMMYVYIFLVGLTLCVTEWKKIKTTNFKKILYVFTLPIFMFTYIPISVRAMFGKVGWKPIIHTSNVKIEELEKTENK